MSGLCHVVNGIKLYCTNANWSSEDNWVKTHLAFMVCSMKGRKRAIFYPFLSYCNCISLWTFGKLILQKGTGISYTPLSSIGNKKVVIITYVGCRWSVENRWVLLGWFWVLYLTPFSSSYPINLFSFVCGSCKRSEDGRKETRVLLYSKLYF